VRKYFRTANWEPWDESIKAIREVRKLRQKPAHALNENLFDQSYFKKQRELIIKAYSAIRALRLLLANHRLVRNAKIPIPEWIEKGDIWTF
jgi:chorismate-pyruvate lyase